MSSRGVLGLAGALWRSYGTHGLVQRALYEARKRTGRYRRKPLETPAAVGAADIPASWPFVVDADRVRESTDHDEATARAQRVLGGEHQAFRWTWTPLPRTPVEWRTHPVSRYEYGVGVPWYLVGHYNRDAGDVKDVWEPARFGWAYDLMRGWMITGDDAYARAFWERFENFMDGNPPFLGVQWSCGQETSIRAMAWLWAECAFRNAPSSSAERLARLRQALVWSGDRVDDAIGYALAQRNNHGLSEATGIIVLGARFLGVDPRAEGWMGRGHALLERQVLDQFGDDGWYVQHSFNYMRLALEQLVVAQRVLASRGRSLSLPQRARIAAAAALLGDVMTGEHGRVPNHGANDGAYVLPISTANYLDFRPLLTSVSATFGSSIPEDIAPSDEVLAWLGGDVVRAERRPRSLVRSGSSGWVVARVGDVMLFARAGRYTSRPSHIDPLHVDVWMHGRPVVTDAGTYRYWAAPPWANGLVDAEHHNTLTIEGMPVALRGPRFLWLRWPSAHVVATTTDALGVVRIELANDSWSTEGVQHRRVCQIENGAFTVIDEIRASPSLNARATVHWLIDGDARAVEVTGSQPVAMELLSGDTRGTFGWISEGYADKRVATSVRASAVIEQGRLRLISTFGP